MRTNQVQNGEGGRRIEAIMPSIPGGFEVDEAKQKPRPDWALFVRLAWSSLIGAFGKMALLFLASGICSVVFGLLERRSSTALSPIIGDFPPVLMVLAGFALLLPAVAIEVALLAPVAVAVHRFVLLEEVSPGFSVMRRSCLGFFAAWMIGVEFLFSLVELVGAFLGVLCTVVLTVLFVRTLLIFPAVALEVPSQGIGDRIEGSLSATRGLSWSIFFAVFVAALPLSLLQSLPVIAAMRPDLLKLSTQAYADVLLYASMLEDFLKPVVVGILAAVASWIYLWRQEYPEDASS